MAPALRSEPPRRRCPPAGGRAAPAVRAVVSGGVAVLGKARPSLTQQKKGGGTVRSQRSHPRQPELHRPNPKQVPGKWSKSRLWPLLPLPPGSPQKALSAVLSLRCSFEPPHSKLLPVNQHLTPLVLPTGTPKRPQSPHHARPVGQAQLQRRGRLAVVGARPLAVARRRRRRCRRRAAGGRRPRAARPTAAAASRTQRAAGPLERIGLPSRPRMHARTHAASPHPCSRPLRSS